MGLFNSERNCKKCDQLIHSKKIKRNYKHTTQVNKRGFAQFLLEMDKRFRQNNVIFNAFLYYIETKQRVVHNLLYRSEEHE